MREQNVSQNSVLVVTILVMGFVVVTALVVRQGPVQIMPTSATPGITIDLHDRQRDLNLKSF